MLYLGVRRSYAILIGRKHESKDGLSVTFAQFKGRKKIVKVLTLPVLPPLRAVLDAGETGEEAYLQHAYGEAWANGDYFGNWFRDRCRDAGLPQCSPHGLRKIGAVRAAEAGASEHELMATFGGKTRIRRASIRARPRRKNWPRAGRRNWVTKKQLSHLLSRLIKR